LISPITGEEIWDLDADISLMHGGSGTCQCYLEVNPWVDLEKTQFWTDTMRIFKEADADLPSNIADAKEEVQSLGLEYDLTYKELRQLESILFRTMSLMRRAGLSEDAERSLMQLMRIISALRMIQRSIWLLEVQSGPIGWALAGIGFVVAGASVVTTLEMS
jgi:hypothetical protein